MIVILTNIPTPYRTAFFDEVARQCDERGIGFKVLYCARTEPNRHWPFEPENMKHPFEILPGWHPRIGSAYPHLNLSVVSRLRSLSPSILVCGGAWNTPTILLAVTKWLWGGKRTVFWSEGHADAATKTSGLFPWLRRWAYSRFDAFAVPNSKSGAWALLNAGRDVPLVPLPNTVDDQFYRRQGPHERAEARAALNIRKDCRLLVQVSQLIPLKGVLELASAFEVVSTGKDASLAIIGSGPLESEMRLRFSNAISAGRLLLPGHVDRTEVRRWLMAADGFVLNTLKDNNPLSPIEASFAELPILLSRKAGNFEEMVRSDDYGFAIDDTSTVQSVIGRFLAFDIDVLRSIGKNCRENADAQFSVKSVVSTFLTKALQLSASKPKIVEVDCHG